MIQYNVNLPASVEDAITELHNLDNCVEISRITAYWLMGRVLTHMKNAFNIENPKQIAAEALHQSERLLGYCMAVFSTITWEQIQALVTAKMRWSTLRVLASSAMDSVRDDLINMYLEGSITAEEIENQATRIKNEPNDIEPEITDGTTTQDLRVKLKKKLAQTKHFLEKATKASEAISSELSGKGEGLETALYDESGNITEDVEELLMNVRSSVQEALFEAVDLLDAVDKTLGLAEWPFTALEERLTELKNPSNSK